LNQKAILEYKIQNEEEFKALFTEFMNDMIGKITGNVVRDKKVEVKIEDGEAVSKEEYLLGSTEIISVVTMTYHKFLKELAKAMKANPKTLHEVFKALKDNFDINNYLNMTTVRAIKQGFDNFMLYKSIDKFGIAYQKISHTVHPTKLTDEKGKPLEEIDASDVGLFYSEKEVAESYYFEDLFYDSDLEKENMSTNLEEVVVFTKIPKNSIKIPVAGGGSYSPDFAYVLKTKEGKKRLYFVVETKNVGSEAELRKEELQKIKHAQIFFGDKVKFETQFSNNKIIDLIKEITENDDKT
jgi:type III restriction enzyme